MVKVMVVSKAMVMKIAIRMGEYFGLIFMLSFVVSFCCRYVLFVVDISNFRIESAMIVDLANLIFSPQQSSVYVSRD